MTSLAEETEEQERWALRLRRPMPAYGRLLENEFSTAEDLDRRLAQTLGRMLRFASRHVPYYRRLFGRVAGDAAREDGIALLATLPILTKRDIHDHRSALLSERDAPGASPAAWAYSSGTTGQPTAVLHSLRSTMMFALLKQREYRWFRLDPAATLAAMRLAAHLPAKSDGTALKSGETVRAQNWPYLEDFLTGPFIGVSAMTPVEERVGWLLHHSPDYLLSYPETLEHLAFAARAVPSPPQLKAIIAISEQLTPSMRSFIERTFGAPVHQNYGLNEIGIVASRCEAGRYHVHNEHCHVEIVDDDGHVCAPGETGRLLVTSLTNFAMPLIRYDTSDLAEAVAGSCPCGRSLPSFGDIVGRYSRVAYLPAGTIGPVLALRAAIEEMPPLLTASLREFQIHQFRDNRMEVRLVACAPMPEMFVTRLRESWEKAIEKNASELIVRYVDAIARSPSGKFQVFTSDFMPPPDR